MNTLSLEYETPQLVEQGLAINLTQSTTQGHCYDGCQSCADTNNDCPCSGVGTSCKADEE
jgi:hypothetical protein